MNYPNQEVKTAFTEALFFAAGEIEREASSHILRLARYLHAENLEAFFASVQAVFASIPYDIQTKQPALSLSKGDEAYCHTLFYLMLSASGGPAHSSVLTARGRIDMLVTFSDKVYIIEFKCNQSIEVALRQIRAQGYAEPYQDSGKKVVLVGINFSTETRNLDSWAAEEA